MKKYYYITLIAMRPSVNSGRSRIRKKLGLQKEESLDEFLQKR